MKNINKNLSFPRFVVGNLPLSKSLLKEEKQRFFNGKVEDPRQKHSGMTPNFNNSAFTLIELLVVVLIIGILAAVALPQYQKAVKRARFATLKNITRALANAEETYYLANGKYTVDVEELDIAFPGTIKKIVKHADTNWQYELENITCTLINNGYSGGARTQCNQNYNLLYGIFLQHNSEQLAGKQRCSIVSTDAASITIDHQICKQESGGAEVAANGKDYFY